MVVKTTTSPDEGERISPVSEIRQHKPSVFNEPVGPDSLRMEMDGLSQPSGLVNRKCWQAVEDLSEHASRPQ